MCRPQQGQMDAEVLSSPRYGSPSGKALREWGEALWLPSAGCSSQHAKLKPVFCNNKPSRVPLEQCFSLLKDLKQSSWFLSCLGMGGKPQKISEKKKKINTYKLW